MKMVEKPTQSKLVLIVWLTQFFGKGLLWVKEDESLQLNSKSYNVLVHEDTGD